MKRYTDDRGVCHYPNCNCQKCVDLRKQIDKKLEYRAANHTIKEDGEFRVIPGKHVCGDRMLCCTGCNRIFCVNCDFIPPDKISPCCAIAIDSWASDHNAKKEKKEKIRKEMAKRKKCKQKFKVEIETIENNNQL